MHTRMRTPKKPLHGVPTLPTGVCPSRLSQIEARYTLVLTQQNRHWTNLYKRAILYRNTSQPKRKSYLRRPPRESIRCIHYPRRVLRELCRSICHKHQPHHLRHLRQRCRDIQQLLRPERRYAATDDHRAVCDGRFVWELLAFSDQSHSFHLGALYHPTEDRSCNGCVLDQGR
jgi:hypothetical protein